MNNTSSEQDKPISDEFEIETTSILQNGSSERMLAYLNKISDEFQKKSSSK